MDVLDDELKHIDIHVYLHTFSGNENGDVWPDIVYGSFDVILPLTSHEFPKEAMLLISWEQ